MLMLSNIDFEPSHESNAAITTDKQVSASAKKILLEHIIFKEACKPDIGDQLSSKYKPVNAGYTPGKIKYDSLVVNNSIPKPSVILYPEENVEIKWKAIQRIGPGLANLGNTCFLNSVLQVLAYTPPLFNYIMSEHHKKKCDTVGFCMQCELTNHFMRVFRGNANGAIRPTSIIQKLQFIGKSFRFGRQEDAHEFLRYVVEAIQKSDYVGRPNLDKFSKETTVANAIFGGLYRSQVKCLKCNFDSNTFETMMDVNLDVKDCCSIVQALQRSVRPDRLEGDNKYYCERCRMKTVAQKRNSIYKEPNVLTLQLKRFDFTNMFGGKISKNVVFPEELDIRPFMSVAQTHPMLYKLYAVLVHSGFSCNSGHYYCYVKASNSVWYEMNDNRVSQVGLQTVLNAQAYLLFYIKKDSIKVETTIPNGVCKNVNKNLLPPVAQFPNKNKCNEFSSLGETTGYPKKNKCDEFTSVGEATPNLSSSIGKGVSEKCELNSTCTTKNNLNSAFVSQITNEKANILTNQKEEKKFTSLQLLNESYSYASSSSGTPSPVMQEVNLIKDKQSVKDEQSIKDKQTVKNELSVKGGQSVKVKQLLKNQALSTTISPFDESSKSNNFSNFSSRNCTTDSSIFMKKRKNNVSESDTISSTSGSSENSADKNQFNLYLPLPDVHNLKIKTKASPSLRLKLFNGKNFNRKKFAVWSPVTKAALHPRIIINKSSSDTEHERKRLHGNGGKNLIAESQWGRKQTDSEASSTSVHSPSRNQEVSGCAKVKKSFILERKKGESVVNEEQDVKKKKKREKKKKKHFLEEDEWIESGSKRKYEETFHRTKKSKSKHYQNNVIILNTEIKSKKKKKKKREKNDSEDDDTPNLVDWKSQPREKAKPILKTQPQERAVPCHIWDERDKKCKMMWNGRVATDVNYLDSHAKIPSWSGEDSSAKFRPNKVENSDRLQDEWDEEYDKGRVKKYKLKNDITISRKNEFQSLQDVRNSSKTPITTYQHHSKKSLSNLHELVKKYI